MKMWMVASLALVVVATGCCRWNEGSEYTHAVFSEDEQAVAAVYSEFQEQNRVSYTATRRHRSQLLISQGLGTARPAAVGELMEGRVIDLFFSRQAGYVVMGRRADTTELDGGGEEAWTWYDKIDLNGNVTPLGGGLHQVMISCDGGTSAASVSPVERFIPSPDGSLIAQITSQTTCTARRHQVRFLNAETLALVAGPMAFGDGGYDDTDGTRFWHTVDMAWTTEGDFAMASWGNGAGLNQLRATVFSTEGPSEQVMGFDCFFPATANGHVNSDSVAVWIHPDAGTLRYEDGPHTPMFGCEP